MGQLPVGGEQHKARHVPVQPPHGAEPPVFQKVRHKIQHRGQTPVLCGGKHPGGLVEHQGHFPGQGHGRAVQGDILRPGLKGRVPHRLPGHLRPAGGNGLAGLGTGEPRQGENFVQTHAASSRNGRMLFPLYHRSISRAKGKLKRKSVAKMWRNTQRYVGINMRIERGHTGKKRINAGSTACNTIFIIELV